MLLDQTAPPLSSPTGYTREERIALLGPLLARRILVLDGAMGTMIQSYRLEEKDYRGDRFADWPRELRGHNDLLTLTQPGIIRAIHSAYLEAGADIVETNSFTSNAMSLADYGMEELFYELNRAAARLARDTADGWERRTPDTPRFVAGVLGPTNRSASLSPDVNDPGFRNVTFDHLAATVRRHDPTGVPLPYLIPGFTDAKAYARLGTTCYGFAPVKFDPTHEVDFARMYHGHDERVPIEGLKWGLRVLYDAVRTFCADPSTC